MPNEAPHADGEPRHQELQELYSAMVQMLRNSATQAEEIQRILSTLLRTPQNGDGTEFRRRPRRPRDRPRRVELDRRLKVRFALSLLWPVL